jgi:signal transduction histidine kinase
VQTDLQNNFLYLIDELSAQRSGISLDEKWKLIICRFFDKADCQQHTGKLDESRVVKEGKGIQVPSLENQQYLELMYKNSEQSFSDKDLSLINAIHKVGMQFASVQSMLEQGASVERQRIARDLHDDVAARMLTLIHQVKDEKTIELARSILKSLRNAIYTLDNKSTTLILDALMDIRAELQERLNTIGMQLFWDLTGPADELTFTPRQHINLHRILNEVATNVIKHAEASFISISIEMDAKKFHVSVCDNGKGFDMDTIIPGKGLNNIRTRVEELGGSSEWIVEDGSCLHFDFPLLNN